MHLREDFCEPPALKYFYGSGTSRKYSDISLIFSHVFVRKKTGSYSGESLHTDQKGDFTAISLDIWIQFCIFPQISSAT